jgi:hypothetical protein
MINNTCTQLTVCSIPKGRRQNVAKMSALSGIA